MLRFHSAVNALLVALVLSSPVFGQMRGQASVTVTGVVEDGNGAAISGVKVTLVRGDTHHIQETVSDENGNFSFPEVSPGNYVLKIEMSGFEPYEKSLVADGQALKPLKIKLKIGAMKQQITVDADAADEAPSTSDSDAATARVDDNLLRQLPTLSEDVTPLIQKFVSPAAQGAEGPSIIIDGVEGSAVDLPASAIRKIRIDRNPYSALFQHPGKAKVEVTTEHGHKKRYDGGFAMYARNSLFDARNAFAKLAPDLDRRLLQANLGGALPGNSSSFYIAAERSMLNQSAVVNAVTLTGPVLENVPTTQHRDNVFARLQWWVSPLHTLYGTYNFNDHSYHNKDVGGFNLPEQGVNDGRHRHRVMLDYSAIIPANWRNDLRFSFSNDNEHTGNSAVAPAIIVNQAFNAGPSQTFTRDERRQFDLQDTVYYAHNKHAITFGARLRADLIDAFDASNFGGTFEFASLGQYAAGSPFVFRTVEGNPNVEFAARVANGFVQDELQVSPQLTLTFGLRYDWQSTIDERANFAPRLAFAFAPGKNRKTVIRGGGGIFYDNFPVSARQRSLLYDGTRLRELVFSNPSFPNPFAAGEASSLPPSVIRVAPDIRPPYLSQTSIGVEHELWHNNSLTVEYAFLHGTHLFRSRNINAPLPETGLRPDPNFVNINQVESTAFERSHAVTATFRGQFGKFFEPYVQYIFSKNINDTSGTFALPANNYDLRPEIGPADFDWRHRLNLMGAVALPQAFHLGLLLSVTSGAPFDITTGFDNNGDTVATDRPPGVTRNTGRGPGTVELDVRFGKTFNVARLWGGEPASKRKRNNLEFTVDAFNVINHTNVNGIVGVLSSPFFGRANSAGGARTVQLSVKYLFRRG